VKESGYCECEMRGFGSRQSSSAKLRFEIERSVEKSETLVD
jgi:hypothetical protein